MFGPSDTPPIVDFSQATPDRSRTPVNRRLCYVDLRTVFCSNDAARASPPGGIKTVGNWSDSVQGNSPP